MAAYKGSIKLIAGFAQANNKSFPLMSFRDVCDPNDDELRLDQVLNEMKTKMDSLGLYIDEEGYICQKEDN